MDNTYGIYDAMFGVDAACGCFYLNVSLKKLPLGALIFNCGNNFLIYM